MAKTTKASTKNTTSRRPGKSKKQTVNVGDLVQISGYSSNHYGTVGIVTRVLDKDTVVLEAIAARDDCFDGHEFIALTYKPTGTHPDGTDHSYYYTWIRKVIHRAVPLPPPPPKPVPIVKKVTTHEELAEVIKVGKKNADVIHVDLSGEAQGGSSASVQSDASASGKS